jgi:hypothetical protein
MQVGLASAHVQTEARFSKEVNRGMPWRRVLKKPERVEGIFRSVDMTAASQE